MRFFQLEQISLFCRAWGKKNQKFLENSFQNVKLYKNAGVVNCLTRKYSLYASFIKLSITSSLGLKVLIAWWCSYYLSRVQFCFLSELRGSFLKKAISGAILLTAVLNKEFLKSVYVEVEMQDMHLRRSVSKHGVLFYSLL